MEKVELGTTVKRLGITRLSVGEGATCRAVLLDDYARMKHIAFDNTIRRRVEVDQDMCIKLALRPSPTFFYLVAKLNTDLEGNIIGSKFTVEYIQLSSNLNDEFANQIREQGKPNSLAINLVKKKGDDNKDFSYLKVTPSNRTVDNPELQAKIDDLRNNTEFIESCWQMVDVDTSLTKSQYLEQVQSFYKEKNQPLPLAYQKFISETAKEEKALPEKQARALPPGNGESVMTQSPDEFNNSFSDAEGFDDI